MKTALRCEPFENETFLLRDSEDTTFQLSDRIASLAQVLCACFVESIFEKLRFRKREKKMRFRVFENVWTENFLETEKNRCVEWND